MNNSEQQEASDAVKADLEAHARAVEVSLDNSASVSEVNRALVGVHQARAALRRTVASAISAAALLGVGWSVWAWVHWA